MKMHNIPVILGLLFTSFAMSADVSKTESQRTDPKRDGYVPDAATAEKIAIAVLTPVFGDKMVSFQKPYSVRLSKETWVITGAWPRPGDTAVRGGTLIVHISKQDGRILQLFQSE